MEDYVTDRALNYSTWLIKRVLDPFKSPIKIKGLKHKLIYKYSDLTVEKIRLFKAHFDQSKSPKPYFSPWLRISHLIVVSYRNRHLSKTQLFSLICMWFSTDWRFWGLGSRKIREKVPLAGSQNTNDETL